MKLSTKNIAVLLLVLLLTLSLSGWLHVQRERHVLTGLMEKHGKSLSHSIAVSCIEILLSEDYPILDSYLETMGKGSDDISFIEVKHHGKVVSKYPTTHEGISDSVIFDSDILFSIKGDKSLEKIGEVSLGLSDRENKMIIAARLRELLIFIASIFVFLALIEILLINKIVIKPIQKLAAGIHRVARGELADHVNIVSRDEIGELAASFNKMTDDLQKTTVSRDYVDSIIKNMMDSLIVLSPNGKIKTVNQAALDLLGYEKDELLNQPFEVIFKDESSGKSSFNKLLKQDSADNIEKTYLSKDGRKIPVIFSASAMPDVDGNLQGIICVAHDITRLKLAEENLMIYQTQLKHLATTLTLTEDRERRRIAEYLHDHIGHALVLVKMKFGVMRRAKSSNGRNGLLGEIHTLLDKTIQDTRSLTYELSPLILYQLDFESAIEWLTEQFQERYKIVIEFAGDGLLKSMNDDIRVLLFSSIRELLFNVVKHAKTSKAKVSVKRYLNNVQIKVEDNGVGFDLSRYYCVTNTIRGFGVFNIRERVENIGGQFEIKSEPGCGTQVTLVAPLKYEDEPLHNAV
jgi:PAS domain S-box-containing protein